MRIGFPGGSDGKESACNAGDPGLIPGSGRSPGEVNGNPLEYSCLENPMDRGGWRAIVHGVSQSQNLENSSAPLLLHTHLLAQATATFPGGGRESSNWSPCFTSIQSVFTRHFPWARPCSPHWGYSSKQKLAEIPVLVELAFYFIIIILWSLHFNGGDGKQAR